MFSQTCQYNSTDELTVRPAVKGIRLQFQTTNGSLVYLSHEQVKAVAEYCQKWCDSLPKK